MFLFAMFLQLSMVIFGQRHTYIPFNSDGMWGYKNQESKVVIAQQFSEADLFMENLARVKDGGAYMLIDRKGQVVSKRYDTISVRTNGIAVIGQKNSVGNMYFGVFKKSKGEIVPPKYSRVLLHYPFLLIEQGGKWGCMDTSGKYALPLEYDLIEVVSDAPIVRAYLNGQIYFFDAHCRPIAREKGAIVSISRLKNTSMFIAELRSESHSWKEVYVLTGDGIVESRGSYEMIDEQNEHFTPNGLFVVKRNGKYGLINDVGEEIVQTNYAEVLDQYHGQLFKVKQGDRTTLVDRSGKDLLPSTSQLSTRPYTPMHTGYQWVLDERGRQYLLGFDSLGKVHEEWMLGSKEEFVSIICCPVKDILLKKGNLYGLRSLEGRKLLPFKFDKIRAFDSLGYKTFGKNLFRMYTSNGKQVLKQLKLDSESEDYDPLNAEFQNGFLMLKSTGKWGVIDEAFRIVLPFEFDRAPYRLKNFLLVESVGKFGLRMLSGNEVVPCKYEAIDVLGNSTIFVMENGQWSNFSDHTVTEKYSAIESYDSLIRVAQGNNWGLLDQNGHTILPVKYWSIGKTFSSNLHVVVDDSGAHIYSLLEQKSLLDVPNGEIKSFIEAIFLVRVGEESGLWSPRKGWIVPMGSYQFRLDQNLIAVSGSNEILGYVDVDGTVYFNPVP